MQSLVFFNKEGDNLNFIWDEIDEIWRGDLIFHQNSDDTFKTIGLYIFEKIPSFDYEKPGEIFLEKFQLFNESRFNITGNQYFTQSVTKIQVSNLDPVFFSKWIFGQDFEKKFPVGSQIKFDSEKFEFTNKNQSYTVIKTKKNAILIITNLNNRQFNDKFGEIITEPNITISGVNSLGVYDYITEDYVDKFSKWNEPQFYDKYFDGKKMTFINTQKNDGVYTVKNYLLNDKVYKRFEFDSRFITQSASLTIDLKLKTDLPTVYIGGLNLNNNKIEFSKKIPKILKPGVEFTIPNSQLNTLPLILDSIEKFTGINTTRFFSTFSQVIWNNEIKECKRGFTWTATSSILPSDSQYWGEPTFLNVTTQLQPEQFLIGEIQLTTNRFTFSQAFTQSLDVTIASSVERYVEDMNFFNIDYHLKNKVLYVTPIYPSDWCDVKILLGDSEVGISKNIYEQNVEIEEILKPEINTNISENFSYNVVFTDIDEYGIKFVIGGQEYYQEVEFIFDSLEVNLPRTIDKTLRNWFTTWYIPLSRIGIIPKLKYTGKDFSPFVNTIQLTTEYPNVELDFRVQVGTTANYYIPRTQLIFNSLGSYFTITINDREYGEKTVIKSNGLVDFKTTLENWVENWGDILSGFGIFPTSYLSMIQFDVKSINTRFEISVNTGNSSLPGLDTYTIRDQFTGNFGALITSNQINMVSATHSFEGENFATGQLITINNSPRVLNNQEYNIELLEPDKIGLSYQGPFWGTLDPLCNISPFVTVAFTNGFGATGCTITIPPQQVGEYNLQNFSPAFSITLGTTNSYTLNQNFPVTKTGKYVDIIYLDLLEKIYVLGTELYVIDSVKSLVESIITLPNNTTKGIKLSFNRFNNYLYCLTERKIYVVDPTYTKVDSVINLSLTASSISINPDNGDVWVGYDTTKFNIWSNTNFGNTASFEYSAVTQSLSFYNFVYNESESDMYVTSDDVLFRFNGDNRQIQATYSISGLDKDMYYNPVKSSIYLFNTTNVLNINGGVVTQLNITHGNSTSDTRRLVFNNLKNQMILSTPSGLTVFDLDGNLINYGFTNEWGPMVINQHDGDIYLASQNTKSLFVVDSNNLGFKYQSSFTDGNIKEIIYNPERESVFGIIPNDFIESQTIFELGVSITTEITEEIIESVNVNENGYGTLDANYQSRSDIWLKTREYLRRPRENFNDEQNVDFIVEWVDDQVPEIFLYDFSGDQLETTGPLAYIGSKPLEIISLNRTPNDKFDRRHLSEFQQTVFDQLKFTLEHIDSNFNSTIKPVPIEIFIGSRSDNEGVLSQKLNIFRRESIQFTVYANANNRDVISFSLEYNDTFELHGIIAFDLNSETNFRTDDSGNPRGFKPGQIIKIEVLDETNQKNKYISKNNGILVRIHQIFTKYMIVKFIDRTLQNEFSQIDDYPKRDVTTYLTVRFTVMDKLIAQFDIHSQTEIEDERYRIELSNYGHLVEPDDIFIFKTYDINEQGIDWNFLNSKRKEMLMVRDQIFSYVGSYKAIINSINFFGYNDLQLYEYYRNIDIKSPDFYKLFKVEIPDIFDNSVDGWKENDFIKHTFPNPSFEETNLFNLTYRITDTEGTNLLIYSLAEVVNKLQGLKIWLERKVIPITHRILDITGRADFVGNNLIQHRVYDTKSVNIKQSFSPVDFNLNEAYLMPVNSGSTVYTCHVDFFLNIAGTYSETPDYFTLKVKTYKTYREWDPFANYNIGDRVVYYEKIWESTINNNRLKSPRKYESVLGWQPTTNYSLGQFAQWDRLVYQYIATQSSFDKFGTVNAPNPFLDSQNSVNNASWIDMTEWKSIDLVPCQTFYEFRNVPTYSSNDIEIVYGNLTNKITAGNPFNFTIDSNIDPFITIEVTSENGFGQTWTQKKNYEIRGLNDLFVNASPGDPITSFKPITPHTDLLN